MLRKSVINILMTVFILSCAPIEFQNVVGRYKNQSIDPDYELLLNNDSTFIFYTSFESSFDTILGKWTINRDELVLNMFTGDTPYYVVDSIDNSNAEIAINVFDPTYSARLNASYEAYYKNNLVSVGLANVSSETIITGNVDSLHFTMLGQKQFGFRVNSKMKKLNVFLPFEKQIWIDKIWEIRGDKIYAADGFTLIKE